MGLMQIHEIDNADELDRFARESQRGNGVLIGAYDGLVLSSVARELRSLRAEVQRLRAYFPEPDSLPKVKKVTESNFLNQEKE